MKAQARRLQNHINGLQARGLTIPLRVEGSARGHERYGAMRIILAARDAAKATA